MIKIVILCIAGALILGLLLFLIIWKIRSRRFSPTKDKKSQQSELNQDLENAGFAYDGRRDIFYSRINCWQREMGYCRLYDEGAPGFNMVMHCEPVTFSYKNKRWLIELWKGQYGITTGGEIGIYNTDKEDISVKGFSGPYYESAQDQEMLPMSFKLHRNGKFLFKCNATHWWLTGFRLGEFSDPDSLSMDARIKFPDTEMLNDFVNALTNLGYQSHEYAIRRRTVTVHYTIPHSEQPVTQDNLPKAVVQTTNHNNCILYNQVTHKYKNTLDKLEYLKNMAPELYEFCMHSLYARSFYDAFSWLLELIHGGHKPHPVQPRVPCPPRPPKSCGGRRLPNRICTPQDCCCPPDPCGCRNSCGVCRPSSCCCGDTCCGRYHKPPCRLNEGCGENQNNPCDGR